MSDNTVAADTSSAPVRTAEAADAAPAPQSQIQSQTGATQQPTAAADSSDNAANVIVDASTTAGDNSAANSDVPAAVSQSAAANSNSSSYHGNQNQNQYYNNNSNNPNYQGNSSGKHYNKNYQGNRQGSYSGSGSGPHTNRQHYGQGSGPHPRKYSNSNPSGNPQKLNHHNNNNQNNYYNAYQAQAQAAAANMYQYSYIPYGYQVLPNMPMTYSAMPPQQYVPVPHQLTPTPTKVKLTTKDGKPVDLEEKKKKTSSETPVSSPGASVASPVVSIKSPVVTSSSTSSDSGAKETTTTASAAIAPAKSASSNAAVEEFKRKIAERLAAKEKEKELQQKAEEEKEKAELQRVKKEQEAEEKAKQEAQAAEAADAAKIAADAEAEAIASQQESKIDSIETPEAEINAEEVVGAEPAESEPEPVSKEEDEIKDDTTEEIASADTTEEIASADTTATGEEGEEESEEPQEPESSFTISNFLTRLETAEVIEDPFTTKYPENIVAPDSSKKLESKKYRYDPGFLIQFRAVVQYPIDAEFKSQLEKVDISTNVSKKSGQSGSSRNLNKFGGNALPNRFNGQMQGRGQFNDGRQNSRNSSKRRGTSGSSREKSTRKGNQSKRGGRDFRDKTEEEPPKPAEDVKPLEQSANRWVPRSRQSKKETKVAEDGTEILEPEDVERKVKSLLNKLTLEMFAQITDDMLKIAFQSKWEKDAVTLRSIVSLTFAKACDEPYWSEMYAKFCAKMCTSIPAEVVDESITINDGHPSGGDLARRILITTCQTEYEKGWVDKLPTNEDGSPLEPEMMSDEYYAMAAAKRRGLGLVKFIGHLYNLNMLNDQVIFVCLRDQCKNTVDPSEDSLENLVQLVKTVGPKLDADERKRAILKIVFDKIDEILKNVKLSSRIMFMLMDLQDLRKSKWISTKADAGPKTIEEIHRDAEIKRMEDQRASNEKKQRRINEGRSNSSRGGSNWNNSGSSNFLNNMKFSAGRAPSNGPNNSNSSDQGLQRETSKRSESTHVNRFAALGDDEDNNDGENEE